MNGFILAALLLQLGQPPQAAVRPGDVGRIADLLLDSILPPHLQLGRMTVGERGIRLDAARTDMGLRRTTQARTTVAQLGLVRNARNADRSLVADCDMIGRGQCRNLGDAVYVWIELDDKPLSALEQEVLPRPAPTGPGQLRVVIHARTTEGTRRNMLGGISVNATVCRDATGSWRIVRIGPMIAG